MIRLHLQGSGEASLPAVYDALLAREVDPPMVATLDADALHVELHPAAEPIRIARTDEGLFSLDANTVTAGPGYHRHVVTLAESLDVTWDRGGDDTGWRESRDDDALEEMFLDWLGAAAAQILEWVDQGGVGFALAMPAGHRYEHRGVVATQLGPRDLGWLAAGEHSIEVPEIGTLRAGVYWLRAGELLRGEARKVVVENSGGGR